MNRHIQCVVQVWFNVQVAESFQWCFLFRKFSSKVSGLFVKRLCIHVNFIGIFSKISFQATVISDDVQKILKI